MFSIGENFLGAFLPELAPRTALGRISAFSWACAYAAALLLLILITVSRLRVSLFRIFPHSPSAIDAVLVAQAFRRRSLRRTVACEVAVYSRSDGV
jgi:MFS-type transporter involved in bile tolerance (Atg22 family)